MTNPTTSSSYSPRIPHATSPSASSPADTLRPCRLRCLARRRLSISRMSATLLTRFSSLVADYKDDEFCRGFVIGEVAADFDRPPELCVQSLNGVRNRYEDVRCRRPAGIEAVPAYGATIRDRGTGSTKCGQADVFDELRARVSSWPPLRLARLRRERGSVGVVSPPAPVFNKQEGVVRRVIGLDIHRTFAEAVAWEEGRLFRLGRVDMTRTALEGFGKCLRPSDEVVVEATGNAMAVVRVLSPFVARVGIAHPLQGKGNAPAHGKTGKIDAGGMASLHAAGFLPEVWTPDPETERLRRLVARRNQLVRHRTRIKNEVHAILHAHLIPRCPHADVFNRRGRDWLSRQPLPADEKATIDRHVRELDRLAEDLDVLDREVAQGAIGNPSIERLITITGVNLTVAAGLRCSPQRRRRSRSCSRHRPAPAASSTAPGPGTKTGSGSRSPPINVRASRLSISLPSASALATLSTGRSISVPSSQRPG